MPPLLKLKVALKGGNWSIEAEMWSTAGNLYSGQLKQNRDIAA
jgi:hypothetical protein